MQTFFEAPLTRQEIIKVQRAKLERVVSQLETGESIEVIRYGGRIERSLLSAKYNGGNKDFYAAVITGIFNDSCEALESGQRLRIQVCSR